MFALSAIEYITRCISRIVGGAHGGPDSTALEDGLRKGQRSRVVVILAEDLPNDGRARVARDLRVVAAQIECGQSCSARLSNLCVGDLELRLPDAHLIAFAKNAREGIGHRNPDRI